MSGFSEQWLDLREPADHAARDQTLLGLAAARLDARPHATLVDLGCGTGASYRALGPQLQARQTWHLVDHDPGLLRAAQARLAPHVAVETHALDLRALDTLPLEGADLVTASALFDLAGDAWLSAFTDRLAQAGVGLYTVLTYDGRMDWSTPLPADAAVVEAFNRHQRGDKGLGPALGPAAGGRLVELLQTRGYRVQTAASPWVLNQPGPFQQALLEGIAQAATEAGMASEQAQDWLAERLGAMRSCTARVGHVDVLAFPPG